MQGNGYELNLLANKFVLPLKWIVIIIFVRHTMFQRMGLQSSFTIALVGKLLHIPKEKERWQFYYRRNSRVMFAPLEDEHYAKELRALG